MQPAGKGDGGGGGHVGNRMSDHVLMAAPRERFKASSAVYVVFERDGRICTFERHGTGWRDGFVSIPAGGVEAGESLRASAAREAQEEVGVELAASALILVHIMHCRLEDGDTFTGHFFLARGWQGEPVIAEPERHRNLAWHPVESLPDSTIPYLKAALEAWHRGESYSEWGWAA